MEIGDIHLELDGNFKCFLGLLIMISAIPWTSSIRGWGSCDLAVSKSFVEGTVEYRFPVWKMISGALFVDAGSDLGSQKDVPGKPGKLLQKSGSGYSIGGGVGVKTPIGPLRLDVASKDLSGELRYTLGVGWKF